MSIQLLILILRSTVGSSLDCLSNSTNLSGDSTAITSFVVGCSGSSMSRSSDSMVSSSEYGRPRLSSSRLSGEGTRGAVRFGFVDEDSSSTGEALIRGVFDWMMSASESSEEPGICSVREESELRKVISLSPIWNVSATRYLGASGWES